MTVTVPLFVVTWIMAPGETLSGTTDLGAVKPPPRGQNDAPIMHLYQPRLQRGAPTPETIYGLERTWLVSLTFDDGPHPVYTRRLLDILARHEVKATFFINGYWIDEDRRRSAKRLQDLLRRAYDAGHTIGNHTYGHALLSRLSPQEQDREIITNHQMIMELTGARPTLFRPPYAVLTDHARELIDRLGYTEARWSATAPDQEIHDPKELSRTVMSWLRTYNGGIVMLHDRYRWSVEAVELILGALERENCRRLRRGRPTFQVVSLDSFLRPPPQSFPLHVKIERKRHLERLRRICSIP